jgi:hypothetical protein
MAGVGANADRPFRNRRGPLLLSLPAGGYNAEEEMLFL